MLQININTIFKAEFEYTCSIIFNEFLGINYQVNFENEGTGIQLFFEDKVIRFSADFWEKLSYLSQETIPKEIIVSKNELFPEKNLPILFGDDEIICSENNINCGMDVFATVFFMLSHMEEVIETRKDKDGRFPGENSLAFKFDFLNRPIVDEYVEFIWNLLQKIGFNAPRKNKKHHFFISCDVDHPFESSTKNIQTTLKTSFGDIIKRKSPRAAFRRIKLFVAKKLGSHANDKNYIFDQYLTLCEKHKHKAAFYFISDNSEPRNGSYHIEEVQNLLKLIDNRGHEIGTHGSYNSFNNQDKIKNEKKILTAILAKNDIQQKIKGNRQHYLRWNATLTPDLLENEGYEYDTTGGYADKPGFKYGTANEFSMWSWSYKKRLNLKQRPLIVMESTFFDEEFLNIGVNETSEKIIISLRDTALKYGNFSLLWHNNRLQTQKDFEMFERIISI